MMRCEEHGLTYPDDGECRLCQRKRQRAEAVDQLLTPPVEAAEPVEPFEPVEEEVIELPPPPTASAEETARIEDEIRRIEAGDDDLETTAKATDAGGDAATPDDEAPKDDAQPVEDGSEAPADDATPAGDGAVTTGRILEAEMSDARIQELIDKKANVVGLLGFPGTGKTWFLNRLKFELFTSRHDRHEAIPPHAPQWHKIGRTNGVTEHFFRSTSRDVPSSFYMIDIPGERFVSLAEGRFKGREKELLALKACKALIIVMPADDVLMGERASALYSRPEQPADPAAAPVPEPAPGPTAKGGKGARKTALEKQASAMAKGNARLEQFISNIVQLNVVLSLLDQGVDVVKIAGMASEDLVRHLDSDDYKPTAKPVFVALSKADVLEREALASLANASGAAKACLIKHLYPRSPVDLEMLQEFDRDPQEAVDRFRSTLASAVNAFRWSKFDFVTAFKGHGQSGVDDTVVDYTLERRGVAAVLRWMEWARASDSGLTAADWRAIAVARSLRRFRDEGRFRKPKRADQYR
jgi:hypothetical protein